MQLPPNVLTNQHPVSPPGSNSGIALFVERWWVDIPGVLRRYSLLFSEAWSDGIYLTAWPLQSALAPLVVLLIGLIEGVTHWSLINDSISFGQPAIAFTELLPLMIFTAAVGAISANLGLMVVLGYAIGDLFIFGSISANTAALTLPDNPLLAFIYLRVPQLVSYSLFFLLAVMPTLSTKYLVVHLSRFLKVREPTATILRVCALAATQGVIVYVWTLAAPLLIRVFWGWTNASPPLAAAYYLQALGYLVVTAAVVGAGVRGWLAHRVSHDQVILQRMRRLAAVLKAADTRLAFSRRLPAVVRCVLVALSLTLLISGFIASLVEGIILFLFMSAVFIARTVWLPRLSIWVRWMAFVARIPLLLRLIVGAFFAYYLTQAILTAYTQLFPQALYNDTPSATLRPVLLGMCLSLLIMTILLPRVSPMRPTASSQPIATRPF
jgi:hypothetical protein